MACVNYYGNLILDNKASGCVLALHTGDPGTTTGAANEVVGGSYARKPVTFGAAANKASSNTAEVSFDGMPAATVTHVSVHDGSGNPIFYFPLTASKVVGAGQTLTFAIGDITNTVT